MRGNPEAHELIAPGTLAGALSYLAEDPGMWTPIAGGTELMVAYAAGRLRAHKLLSLQGLSELESITATEQYLSIGGSVTFSELRASSIIASEFPLLARAASWVGSIANQSRATVAGNIVNGSPAADAPPALLVYDAEIELISQSGRRRMAYAEFHTSYKQNRMNSDELVLSIHLPRRFMKHASYLRKVGTRRAMAITKVAIAATAIVKQGIITEIHLAAASLADRPVRLFATETALLGQPINMLHRNHVRAVLLEEAKPIDDIRSTAAYRKQVAANLLDEFLDELCFGGANL